MIKECVICSAPFQAARSDSNCCSGPCGVEKKKRYWREWVAKNRGKRLRYRREWAAKNPGKHLRYQRKWKAKNSERVHQSCREWKAKNPERVRRYKITEREKNKNNPKLGRPIGSAQASRKKYAAQLLRLKAHVKKVGAK